ncbi:hypothetical protein LEMA_P028620.1 [Plenodomus lingam JN3]|uniref:Uncharacterized protein n=1 Tax=Leptosphaeria maculans (strain JN3 / isolate v23.1.3 / race Av1-4-5-6-7-8) TaxID=985895 RepID=E4ZVT4_LEPMJ|nr:hypothetical protein LEMA_P028620.1 [Plenodomus lingam JN3]CBX95710.1 hypothetical protein LEMA_P028620.1 [Plenodomus lingam JN3]
MNLQAEKSLSSVLPVVFPEAQLGSPWKPGANWRVVLVTLPACTQPNFFSTESDRALSDYVNTREDTLRIRRTLSKYLTSSLRPVNSATQNQHLNHEIPFNLSVSSTTPPGLKGRRFEYLQALRANNQARTRHRELQTSLQDLQNQQNDNSSIQIKSPHDNEAIQSYVSLLRQRKRFAELQIIQDSLEKLLIAKPPSTLSDPRATIKDAIGEQPDLPAESIEHLAGTADDQSYIFRLKQEVLEAKVSMERAQDARAKAQSQSQASPSLQHQVIALGQARDEIVHWVQGELAKLEEESIFLEDASPIKRSTKEAEAPLDLASAETRIREAYNKYTSSRASLLEAYESLHQTPPTQGSGHDQSSDTKAGAEKEPDASKPIMPFAKLMPYLPHLTQTANSDRALLQQSVYIQNQITSADQEIEEALLRLSGESHMLPAGSKDISAWGQKAQEAETRTEEVVKEHLQASRQEISSVTAIVDLCSLQSKVLEVT